MLTAELYERARSFGRVVEPLLIGAPGSHSYATWLRWLNHDATGATSQ